MGQNKLGERNVPMEYVISCVCKDVIDSIHALSLADIKKLSNDLIRTMQVGGKILVTGIGKPGYVAQKCAATLKSIRVNAEYLDAITAGHGDLGSISATESSLLIMLSKSGKSTELLTLCKNVNVCCPCTSIVLLTLSGDVDGLKQMYADVHDFSIVSLNNHPGELDGFGIIPSTSNALFETVLSAAIAGAMHTIGDATDWLARLKASHPSGTLQNKVTALLNTNLEGANSEDTNIQN